MKTLRFLLTIFTFVFATVVLADDTLEIGDEVEIVNPEFDNATGGR
ncbi:MAG: hypothetical protein K5683_04285 [Prevotella sp.]|nr:hypothetical protein [Prevotella sp.]